MNKQLIVISGINLTDSGKLSILTDCTSYLNENLSGEWRIIVLVPELGLLSAPNIEQIEFPLSKKRWLYRLYYEYIYFYFLSKRLKPYLWLSLHDMTPNVRSTVRAVYCHNASIFYRVPFKFISFDRTLTLFTLFYKYLYKVNIRKNNYVIVQQYWLKQKFEELFNLKNVIVAHPVNDKRTNLQLVREATTDTIRFFYPTLPRLFKNVEVIAEATKILISKGHTNFEVILTFNASDNKYTQYLHKNYHTIPNLKYIGFIDREQVFTYYKDSHYLLFPSLLETWGLPISEAKQVNLPILVADMPYARESIGDYDKAKLFKPHDPLQLAQIMEDAIKGTLVFDQLAYEEKDTYRGWGQLFNKLLNID